MSRPEAGLEELRNAFDRAVYGAERRAWIIGLMGMQNTDGTMSLAVPDRIGFVFVTTGPSGNQIVTIARNDGKVPLREKMPIRMKRADDGVLVIYGIFNSGGFTDSGMSGDYENNFGVDWHTHRIGTGLEFEWEALMLEQARAYPTTGMLAYMNPFRYYHGGEWKTFEGGTFDLTGYQPSTVGEHAWVILGVNPEDSSTVAVTGPSQAVATDLTLTDANAVDFVGIPVAAVKVRNDSSSIQDITLFKDVHEWFAGLHYSELGDLGNVNTRDGYYGLGPYFNDELYYFGADGYDWMSGGHKVNLGIVKQLTLVDGIIDLADGPTFGLIDVVGEGSADDDLVWIQNGRIGDTIMLHASDPVANGEITLKQTGNINILKDIEIVYTSNIVILVYTEQGWNQIQGLAGTAATVDVPKSFDIYVDVKERLLENNVHGGLDTIATSQALDSVPTDINVTVGISKLMIVVNAGSDFDGVITITGISVDRDTGDETPADTDNITIDALSTDGTTTDGNGNTIHAFTDAYISSKWFKGAVVLSTVDLTLTDVDVYQISFEQFGDASGISLHSVDATAIATNSSAWMDLHLYSVVVVNSKVSIANEGTLELLTSEVNSGNRYRKRLGNLDVALDGTTDGIWLDAFWGPLANVYWEDINVKVWYNHTIGIDGDVVLGFPINYIDFNVDYEDGVAEGRLQWNIEDGTLEVGMPGGDVNLQIGQEMMIRCRNTTGVTIPNGSVVEIIGASGNKPLISLADASDLTKISVIGLATEDIDHNSNGYVTSSGFVRDINTNGMTIGEPVWLSAITPGAYTQTRPTAPDFSFAVGVVIMAHTSTGVLYVGSTPYLPMMAASDVLFDATPADGEFLAYNIANGRFELTAAESLTDYLYLPGRSGGQIAYGGIDASDDLTLESTAHATKGAVILQPNGRNVHIGSSTPNAASQLSVVSAAAFAADISLFTTDGDRTDWLSFNLYGYGQIGSLINHEKLWIYWDTADLVYKIESEAQGTATLRPLVLQVEGNDDQLYLETDGKIYINKGASGATAGAGADDLIVEQDENAGISILCPDADWATILMGTPTDPNAGRLRWDYTNNQLTLGTGKSSGHIRFMVNNYDVEGMRILSSGNVGINIAVSTAKLHIDQSSLTGAKPVLQLDQADLSEELIRFDAAVATGNPIDLGSAGTYQGKIRISVNGTFRYLRFWS